MKHLAVALIVITIIAADFGADLWLGKADNHGWDVSASWAIVAALLWFATHMGDES